jgi:hypothetical protein
VVSDTENKGSTVVGVILNFKQALFNIYSYGTLTRHELKWSKEAGYSVLLNRCMLVIRAAVAQAV